MKIFELVQLSVVVTELQKLYSFLPLRYQVDIRTASFMLHFKATDNFIGNMFAIQVARILARIYTRYGDSVDSINSLKDATFRQFTGIRVLILVFVCFLLIILEFCVFRL